MPVGSAPCWSLPVSLIAFGCLGAAAAQGAVLNFEGLADSTPVDGIYAAQGVTFTGTVALTSGISLNEFEFPPASGMGVASDDGGPVSGTFTTPVTSLSASFTYVAPVTLRGFDATDTEVVMMSSAFAENFVSSGNPANEVLSLSHAGGIHRFSIEGLPAGYSFAMDDFSFTPVPEASSAAVVGAALGAFAWFRRVRPGSRNA